MSQVDPFCSVRDLYEAFRAGRLLPRAATEMALARISGSESTLNAFTCVLSERARAAAERAGMELAMGIDRGALHGVPIAVKDILDIAGEVTGYGSAEMLRSEPTVRSARLVERLEAAGAVIVGKNNCLEFAYGAVHPDVGQTNNPHAPDRTAGGSSGGGAAAVAAGCVWGAVGTDTGGSIRIPAAYCGITGIKPTFGAVPLDGVFPLSMTLDHAGPMTRSVLDGLMMFDVLADQSGPTSPLPVSGLRFGVIAEQARDPVIRPDIAQAFEKSIAALRKAGAQIEDVSIPMLRGAADRLLEIVLPEAALVHRDRLEAHRDAYSPQTRAQLEAGHGVSAITYLGALGYARSVAALYGEVLERFDALLAPSCPWVAPEEDPVIEGGDGHAEILCSGLANLVGAPSISIFCGTGEAGLPVGLMLNGRVGDDRRLLRICAGVEAMLPARPTPALFMN